MLRRTHPKSRIRATSLLAIAGSWALAGYFGYHVVHGRHGLETRARLAERAQLLEFELKTLEGVRTRLSRDVALLAPDAPNSDLVEEIARDVLGYVHPADRILTRR